MQVHSFFIEDQIPKLISIEYHSRFQIPTFQILGLPAPEIQEARERIAAAFQAADFEFPKKKIVVNLAPSSVRKSGTGHDLAIALKILESTHDMEWPPIVIAWGELGLDGSIKAAGRMAGLIELLLNTGPERGTSVLLSPFDLENFRVLYAWRKENSLPVPHPFTLHAASDLKEVPDSLLSPVSITLEVKNTPINPVKKYTSLLPLSPFLERVIGISLTGKHHILLLGPKGVGKSESIQWYRTLIPSPSSLQLWDQCLNLESRALPNHFETPIRQVHAQVKPSHLLGTFTNKGYQAGELALAHGGILVADEFVEWARDSKECLREPLQTKRVTVTRVRGQVESKCEIQLLATGNLCPCGGLPAQFRAFQQSKMSACRCRATDVLNYFHKLSGPILDRIDLVVLITETPNLPGKPLNLDTLQQRIRMQANIQKAQEFAKNTFGNLPSDLSPLWLEENLPHHKSFEQLLSGLTSLRARHKVLRIARSIQALEVSEELKEEHVFESKAYRFMDKALASVERQD